MASGVVSDVRHSLLTRAIGTAIKNLIRLDAMTNYPATTMLAHRRELLNRTFKAIECVSLVPHDYIKR